MNREPDVRDWLETARQQANLERQLEPDYLFSRINAVPVAEQHPDLTRPKGLILGIIEAIIGRPMEVL